MQREKTIENLKDQLDRLNRELELLETRAEKVRADVKAAYTERLMVLRNQRDKLSEKLGEVERAGKDLLGKWVNEFEVARAALEAGIKEFREHYKD